MLTASSGTVGKDNDGGKGGKSSKKQAFDGCCNHCNKDGHKGGLTVGAWCGLAWTPRAASAPKVARAEASKAKAAARKVVDTAQRAASR